jgi:hypothetical protein
VRRIRWILEGIPERIICTIAPILVIGSEGLHLTPRRFVGIAAASLAVATALQFGAHKSQNYPSIRFPAVNLRHEWVQKPRKIYRYSVIPGGAYSGDELALALRVDPVAAAHYADFERSTVSVHTLSKDEYLYVSYRKADRVFWTANKRRIPKGEPVLSDGKNLARTRCGNRLSGIPQLPIANGSQPTEMALNGPELPMDLELPKAPLLAPEYDAPVLPLIATQPRQFGFPVGYSGATPIGEAFPALGVHPPLMVVATIPSPFVPGPGTAASLPPATSIPSGSIPSGPGAAGISPEPGSIGLLALGGALLATFIVRFKSASSPK